MLVEEFTVPSTNNRTKMMLRLRCETCNTEFLKAVNIAYYRGVPRHYCGFECHRQAMKAGGIADQFRRRTCREKYGSDYMITRPDVASASGKAAHSPDIERRRWKKIREGWQQHRKQLTRGLTLTRSQEEVEFFNVLTEELGCSFECPKHVNGWFVDGWCKEHDLWVQYDGTYWHSSSSAQERDRRQDEWFAQQRLSFVRVSDREWKEDRDAVLSRLRELLRSCGV